MKAKSYRSKRKKPY